MCSLGLVVLSEEIDGLEVVTACVESEISVLVEPVSEVEGKVRLGNPGVVGIGNPVPAGGELLSISLSLCPGESISGGEDLAVCGVKNEVKDGNLGEKVVQVVVDLDTSDGHVVTGIDHTSHLLTLREGNGVSP